MAEKEKKKSFWETLPGIITALSGLLVAVAAVITAVNGGGGKEDQVKKTAPPSATSSANDEAARRAKTEAEAAKAEAERAKAEAAKVKARAEEAERRAAAIETAEEKQTKTQPTSLKQGDIKIDDFTGMRMAYVPTGCFIMGSSIDDKDHQDDEGPVHKVCVDGFWMGQYEVTQGQWETVTVMGMYKNPSEFKKGGNYPVENVSWKNAQYFINMLNRKSGKKYRLPTEAEWEYACRANNSGNKYCCGNAIDNVACYKGYTLRHGSTQPVGVSSNAFNLHDMSGNVREWCADGYDIGYYSSSALKNPFLPSSSDSAARVIRGGGWSSVPKEVRAANRDRGAPTDRKNDLGFRLVLPVR